MSVVPVSAGIIDHWLIGGTALLWRPWIGLHVIAP